MQVGSEKTMHDFAVRVSNPFHVLVLLFVIIFLHSPVSAQSSKTHISASLVFSTEDPKPGSTVKFAIKMSPAMGWHGYWSNPGESGAPVTVKWTAPEGVSFSPLQHPAPHLLQYAGIGSYVHDGAYTLLGSMKIPRGLETGTSIPVKADLQWLTCSDSQCVPESTSLNIALTVGSANTNWNGSSIISTGERNLPKPVSDVTMTSRDGSLVFSLPSLSLNRSKVRVYPEASGWFTSEVRQFAVVRDGRLELSVASQRSSGSFAGVVSDGTRSYRINVPSFTKPLDPVAVVETDDVISTENSETDVVQSLPASGPVGVDASSAVSVAQSDQPASFLSPSATMKDEAAQGIHVEASWLLAFMGAVLGGLLLNLMPCVFPILSLKALNLSRVGLDRRQAYTDGLAYAAGSITAAVALGGLLLALRAAGQEVGWSFQLQSPHMILILFMLTAVIGLNLAGLFEFQTPSIAGKMMSKSIWQGSFLTGVLAAVIATPCSGPFMAGALGAALVLSPIAAIAVFAGLGLGMALPFVAIAYIPALQRRMPKPGPWMVTFRRLLSLPMFATAIGLAWVLGRQSGSNGMTIGLILVVAVGAALWWFGVRQKAGMNGRRALVPAALAVSAALVIDLPEPVMTVPVVSAGDMQQPFDTAQLDVLRQQGKPVFLDFTADWCLTCKVNEKVAINTDVTRRAFAKGGVVTMTGDWTKGDKRITQFLAAHGRNSIPFYVYYPPNGEPQILPQILSNDLLVEMSEQKAT